MPRRLRKATVSLFVLLLISIMPLVSVQGGSTNLVDIKISLPSSIAVNHELTVNASVIAYGCGSCVVNEVKALLCLPSQADLIYGANPSHLGNMRGGELRDASWTVLFQTPGSYLLDVNVSGLDSDSSLYFAVRSAKIDVYPGSSMSGDLNGDGKINIIDISIVAYAFGSSLGYSRWNPAADLDGNGVVNIFDIAMMARNTR